MQRMHPSPHPIQSDTLNTQRDRDRDGQTRARARAHTHRERDLAEVLAIEDTLDQRKLLLRELEGRRRGREAGVNALGEAVSVRAMCK